MNKHIVQQYDASLYQSLLEEYFDGSNYANFGYWDTGVKTAREASDKLMEVLLHMLPEKKGNILDVACGKGGTTEYLAAFFPEERIHAINISEKQLQTAKGNVRKAHFLQMDAVQLAFKDNSFDNLICVEAAFHFFTREQFLSEAFRILKPGGYLIMTDVLFQEGAEARMRSFHEENYLQGLEHYKAFCSGVGFRKVGVTDVTAQCWHGHFWNAVTFIHAKYLDREVNLAVAQEALSKTYSIASELHSYLLVSLQK